MTMCSFKIKDKFWKKTHTKTQKSPGDQDSASYMFNIVTMCFNQTKKEAEFIWSQASVYALFNESHFIINSISHGNSAQR